jgi:hypothetical protein
MRFYAATGSEQAPTDHVMFTFKVDAGMALSSSGGVAAASDARPRTRESRRSVAADGLADSIGLDDSKHVSKGFPMTDRATPNLPSRDLAATSQFYAQLGFHESFRDDGWLILEPGPIQLEFFPRGDLDPCRNMASCCIRVSDARRPP